MPEPDPYQILDFMPEGICIIDHDFSVRYWNRTLEMWTSIRSNEISGRPLLEHFPHLNQPMYRERIEQVFSGGPPVLFSSQLHPYFIPSFRPDGKPRRHNTVVRSYPVGLHNQILGIIILEDVTDTVDQVRVVRDLRDQSLQTQKALAKANKKMNLLSSITRHDILNQIMVLDGYLYLLEEPGGAENFTKYLERLKSATAAIRHQIVFTREYEDIGVKNPVWHHVATVAEKGFQIGKFASISIDLRIGDLEIFADPLLEKVFSNLIDNSVRHGEHADRVTLSFVDKGDRGILVYEDNGSGIPDSMKEIIFERGYGKNTGFGLFLIKEILDITGMTITENGIPGKGARFQIEMPRNCYRA
jgi:PAS domain S-box-containing protein